MTLTINLPPEAETQLRERAAREGRNEVKTVALMLTEALDRAAAVEGIRQGLADSAAGRVTPLAEWDAKFRAKHSTPPDIVPLSDAEAEALP